MAKQIQAEEPLRLVPAKAVQVEIKVVNSRFIASLSPASSVEEARAFIKEISQTYPDASHHVPAFIIGHGRSLISHASDAGEPSGTAGEPALRVLQGSGLGNLVVVVTRYFGGTKLGTGGLARAYADAVKAVLEKTERAVLVHTQDLAIKLPYALFEPVSKLAGEYNCQELEKAFAEEVSLSLRIKAEDAEGFLAQLRDLSRGQVTAELVGDDPETPFPYP